MQQSPTNGMASGAVYVQTNAAPNEVIAFRRRVGDGSLDRKGSVATAHLVYHKALNNAFAEEAGPAT